MLYDRETQSGSVPLIQIVYDYLGTWQKVTCIDYIYFLQETSMPVWNADHHFGNVILFLQKNQ